MKHRKNLQTGMHELLMAIQYHWPPDTAIPPQWMREARALKRAGLCRFRRPWGPFGEGRRPPRAILTTAGKEMVAALDPKRWAASHPPPPVRKRKKRLSEAKGFLADALAGGSSVLRNTIVERGIEEGFSLQQLERAKRALGAAAFKATGSKTSQWFWVLRGEGEAGDS
jgi:hypothetical protein